jgi:hypothetical protein
MKTNKQNKKEKQNKSELQSRSEQLSGNNNSQTATAPEQQPTTAPQKTVRPYVNFEERDRNRQLPVDKVLDTLRQWIPRAYELAEVVGKWIWITFPEQPVEKLRADLSQLGFHWNNTRKCWQHPCGETLPRGQQNPREKYATYFPADRIAA